MALQSINAHIYGFIEPTFCEVWLEIIIDSKTCLMHKCDALWGEEMGNPGDPDERHVLHHWGSDMALLGNIEPGEFCHWFF